MAMTATASKDLRKKVSDAIGLVNPTVIPVSIQEEHCIYSIDINDLFGSVLLELKNKLTSMRQIIINYTIENSMIAVAFTNFLKLD